MHVLHPRQQLPLVIFGKEVTRSCWVGKTLLHGVQQLHCTVDPRFVDVAS